MSEINTRSTELARVPKQARSLKKFNTILKVASKLFHQKGYGEVSVREIGREADVPIATVYQYFPNKLSIVRQLWESYTQSLSGLLEKQFSRLSESLDEKTLTSVIDNVVTHMDQHHKHNPEFLEIWRTVDASPELRALDLEDTLEVSSSIARALRALRPDIDETFLLARALIISETANSTIKKVQFLKNSLRHATLINLKDILEILVIDTLRA